MDARKLQHLVEVIDQGSINKAASKLGLSQPAVTKSLRALERELGVTLVERSSTGVTVTEFGRSLYAHARAVAAELDHAQAEIRRLAGGEQGYLRIGTLPSVSGGLVARAMSNLARHRPDLYIRVVEKQNYELLPALRRREFDFVVCLADGTEPEPGIRHRILLHDQLRIVARAGHPLAGRPTVTCADLVEYPWVHPVVGTSHRPILRQMFQGSGIEPPQARIECGAVQFAKTVMANSDALGLLPAHVIDPELKAGTLICLPIISDHLRRTVGIYYGDHRPLTSAARVAIAEIERVCGGLPTANWDPRQGSR